MPKTLKRRRCRIKAIILLYQSDLMRKNVEDIISSEWLFGKKIDEFSIKLVLGVDKYREEIDALIKRVVENWTIERIAIIDRNIIRVSIYEMLYEQDIPLKVSVDEAIEIAKMFGQKKDTPKFVNGILGKILINIKDQA